MASTSIPFELRHLIYFSHRIIYHIDRKRYIVTVYRIYHGSRRPLASADLPSK